MNRIVELISEQRLAGATHLTISEFAKEITNRNRSCLVSDVRSVTNDRGLARTTEIFSNTRTSSDTRNYKVVQPGMFVYNPSRVNVGSIAWHDGPDPVIVSPMYVVFSIDQSKIVPAYLMLFLGSSRGKNQIESKTEVGARFRLTFASMSRISLPVPPLEVQRGIVEILGTLSKLEAELEAELEARKQQYEHYSETLLAVSSETQRVRFGDIATIVRGASPRPIQRFITEEVDGVPWIKIGDVPVDGKYITSTKQNITLEGAAKSRRVQPGDFVLSNSMSFGRPYISMIEGCIHDGWLAISDFDEYFVADYLYYLLRSRSVQEQFKRRASSGTVQNLNAEIVRAVEIPLPPRQEQEHVVALLDKFDALVNDLSIGLPAELNARRQQYEYYRDKLLTFKELEVAS